MKLFLRKIIKFILSNTLVYSGLAFLKYHLVIRRQKNRFRILVYHRINDFAATKNPFARSMNVSKKDFEKQLNFLTKKFNILPLHEIYSRIKNNRPLPPKTLAITFDDGYKDNFENAYPLLKKYQVSATIFLVSNYVSTTRSFWWDEIEAIVEHRDLKKVRLLLKNRININCSKLKSEIYFQLITYLNSIPEREKQNFIDELKKQPDLNKSYRQNRYRNLTWEDVSEMKKNNIFFGAHTSSHFILSKIPPNQVENEINNSKAMLEDKIKKEITCFAYPHGKAEDFNNESIAILKKSGFSYAVTTIIGVNNVLDDQFRLNRIIINGGESFATFICRCFNIF